MIYFITQFDPCRSGQATHVIAPSHKTNRLSWEMTLSSFILIELLWAMDVIEDHLLCVSVWAVISLWHYHSTFSAADMYNLKLPVYLVMGVWGFFPREQTVTLLGVNRSFLIIESWVRKLENLQRPLANPSGCQWKLYVSFYWYCCEGGVWGTDVRWQTSRCYLFLHVCVCGYTVGAFSMVWPNCPVQRNCQGASRMSPENI